MAKNRIYKAFVAHPSHVLDLNDEVLEAAPIMAELTSEIQGISAYATYVVRNDTTLESQLALVGAIQPAVAGRRAGVTMPDFLVTGKSGRSRKEFLVQYNVVAAYRSWAERVKAVNGTSSKHVSHGWKRTVNTSPPLYGEDYINLGSVDKHYAVIENNPFTDEKIVLKMVIRSKWYRLIFNFDNTRFPEGKVTLPLVKIDNDAPVFIFTVVTDNPIIQFSGDYTIGVDVGINNYATVVVRNSETGEKVQESTLSPRVHSLWNSVRASEKQVCQLRKKAKSILYDRQARMFALDEAQLHREAASRKKRDLAILAAQEIAYLSYFYGNAVVAVEDLSWVSNTMRNGRWNRGELMHWLTHYATQNGGWVVSVNSANTSQLCHLCGSKVTHPVHEVSLCPEHGEMDRDVNAAANIAARAVSRVEKARKTRAKNRKLQPQVALKTPPARASLKYPGRDRTKNKPTPKRKKRVVREVTPPSRPARVDMTTVLADQDAHGILGTNTAALKQDYVTRECRLYSPN